MTIKHYVVNIDPKAQYEWDKVILRNPITGERPDFGKIVADAVGKEAGSYLVAIEIDVKILEQQRVAIERKTPKIDRNKMTTDRPTAKTTAAKISNLVASQL